MKNSQTLAEHTAPFYKAPQVFKGEETTIKVDMWALGIILYELTNKKHPVSKESDITDSKAIDIPSTVPPLFRSIIA